MSKHRGRWAGSALFGAVLLLLVGCSRYDYVRDADQQAYHLIEEKSNDPRWDQPGFAVELDPRSRYFDPYDEISPPMPPDDPASSQFMHHVDGKEHWKYWDEYGHRPELENPGWEEMLPEYVEFTDEGKVRLGLEEAVRLAIIHKPDFQEQFETVYLSALDVSTERFRFDTQFFGSLFTGYENRGPESGNVVNSPTAPIRSGAASSSQWDIESSLVARRRLATAGEVLVGFANSTVWELVGRNQNVSTSLLNFSFVQPLLRAGGRAFALEQLTIVERALLANLRALERFRHGFFTDIAIGNDGVQGPRRRGGFFGGTGLTGFTGQGSGGFGGVGAATGFGGGFGGGAGGTGGGAGTTGLAGGGAGTVGGFLGLLQRAQQIRNSEQNLELQLNSLEFVEEAFLAGSIEAVQRDQFRQNIGTERATLLQARNGYQDALENFLVSTLGLPPDVPVELNDQFISPFRFISDETLKLQSDLNQLLTDFGQESTVPSVETINEYLDRAKQLLNETDSLVEVTREDLKKLEEKAEVRERTMTEAEKTAFKDDREQMANDLEDAVTSIQKAVEKGEALRAGLQADKTKDTANEIVSLIRNAQTYVDELSLIQARARSEVITVDPVTLKPEKALEIARANRLDWMNNRANLVDTWRLIQFNANALKSDISIRVDGDVSTLGGDNPFKFRDETGTIRASLQFDPPFTRLTERNNFRQQLIEYQQSRRQLIQYEDGVYLSLRQVLRNLEQLRVNLEIQRQAVTIAIDRVVQTRANLDKPIPPTPVGAPPGQSGFGPTVVADLLSALSDLRNTQNNYLSVWLNYYASRMLLMRELGLMRIDENGMWIDEPLDLALAAAMSYECDPLPPEIPGDWLDSAGEMGSDPGKVQNVPPIPAPAPQLKAEPKDVPKDEPKPANEPPTSALHQLPACRPLEGRTRVVGQGTE